MVGRHVRLKYQMFMAALVGFILASYGVSELNLPMIKTEESPHVELAVGGL